ISSTDPCTGSASCTTFADHKDCVKPPGSDTGLCVDASRNLFGAVREGISTLRTALDALSAVPFKVGAVAIMTNGPDQAGRVSRSDAISAVNGTSYSMFSVAVGGTDADTTMFLQIVGKTAALTAANASDLVGVFTNVANQIKQQAGRYYLLEYCSPK